MSNAKKVPVGVLPHPDSRAEKGLGIKLWMHVDSNLGKSNKYPHPIPSHMHHKPHPLLTKNKYTFK